MIKQKMILSCLCFFSPAVAAPTMQELFLRANYLYEQGQFQQALDTYTSLSHKGSATWYNMGLCWYRLGNDAHALACWRHAQVDASFKELRMIDYALNAMQQKQGFDLPAGLFFSAGRFLYLWIKSLPPMPVQLLFILGLCLLFFCQKWWYYGKHGKSVLVGATCLVLIGIGHFYIQYQDQPGSQGVVIAQSCVYSGPDIQFHKQGTFDQATEVVIQKAAGNWYKVAQNGVIGWISADAIVVV